MSDCGLPACSHECVKKAENTIHVHLFIRKVFFPQPGLNREFSQEKPQYPGLVEDFHTG